MNTLIRIALRNVMRHRRRALITALTMMVGIAVFIWMDSLMNGIDKVSVDNLINLRDSSVKVFTSAYYKDRASYPLENGIADPQALIRRLSHDRGVSRVTPRTEFLAEVGNYRDTLPVVGVVVDPATDTKVFTLKNYLTGRYFTYPAGSATGPSAPASAERQIILGKELADKLGLKLGQTILLDTTTRYGAENADDFTIVGLLHTTDPGLNQSTVFITYADANDFLDLAGLTTELDLRLESQVNLADTVAEAKSAAKAIGESSPSLTAKSFSEIDGGFLELLKQKRAGTAVLILIILLIAAVGIVNTVLMSVYERIREVGVLKALGLRNREVVWMFTLEGLIVGLLGCLMGAVVGIALEAQLIFVGLPLDKIAGNVGGSGFAFWGRLYGEWNPGAILFAVLFGLAVSLVAAFIPARRAAKMTATAALHFV